MLLIRPAVAEDEPFLFEMLYQALYVPPGGETFPRSVLETADIAHYAAGFGTRSGDVGLVAEIDGKPVGAAWVRQLTHDDPGYGYVDDKTPELTVAVTGEWRGQGVGTALLDQLVNAISRISLSCDTRNEAINLYRRLGFEEITVVGNSVTMLRAGSDG